MIEIRRILGGYSDDSSIKWAVIVIVAEIWSGNIGIGDVDDVSSSLFNDDDDEDDDAEDEEEVVEEGEEDEDEPVFVVKKAFEIVNADINKRKAISTTWYRKFMVFNNKI